MSLPTLKDVMLSPTGNRAWTVPDMMIVLAEDLEKLKNNPHMWAWASWLRLEAQRIKDVI